MANLGQPQPCIWCLKTLDCTCLSALDEIFAEARADDEFRAMLAQASDKDDAHVDDPRDIQERAWRELERQAYLDHQEEARIAAEQMEDERVNQIEAYEDSQL